METLARPALPRAVSVTTRAEEDTRAFATQLAAVARAGDRLALVGPLGAGKTQFAKGFAAGLDVHEVVNSPSFTLMAEYEGRLRLFHQDLYRLAGADEIIGGGLLDERQHDGVTLSEWAERLPAELDPHRLTVRIEITGDSERLITLLPAGAEHERYVHAAEAWLGATRMILVVDTATRTGVLGVAGRDGRLLAQDSWTTAHRHGEELLSRLDRLLASVGAPATDISAIVVGTGPGSFTGLRIGLATAKTLAYGLGVPLVGISTAHGLAMAASGEVTVALPAGASDRYLVRVQVEAGEVRALAAPSLVASLEAAAGAWSGVLIAVDLDQPEQPAEAVRLGTNAVAGLAAALAQLGAAALAAGRHDDVAELVPAYVALPRGIAAAAASVEWSPDLR